MAKKRFPRLNAISYRLNEIWSIDLADMHQLVRDNSGIKYLFVAVHILSPFLRASGMKLKSKNMTMTLIGKSINSTALLQSTSININSRVNRITKLAPPTISQKDDPYQVSLCNPNLPQRPHFKIGDQVRVRRKMESFHRGYKIQFTEKLFTIVQVPTNNPPTYVVKDTKNEIILGIFSEPELVNFTPLHHENGN